MALGHETLAWQIEHGRDDALIGDIRCADLAIDHHAARGSKIEHGEISENGANDATCIGKADDNCKAPPGCCQAAANKRDSAVGVGLSCPLRIAPVSSRPDGHVAEWLRNGLQNRVPRFNSGRGLQRFHPPPAFPSPLCTVTLENAGMPSGRQQLGASTQSNTRSMKRL